MDTICLLDRSFLTKVSIIWKFLVNVITSRVNMDKHLIRTMSQHFRKIPTPKGHNYYATNMYRFDKRLGWINLQVTIISCISYEPVGF